MGKIIDMKADKKLKNLFALKVALTFLMVASCPVLFIWFEWYWSIIPIAIMALMYLIGWEWRAVAFGASVLGLVILLHTWFNWWISAAIPGAIATFILLQAYMFMRKNNTAFDAREKFLAEKMPKTFTERLRTQNQFDNIVNHKKNKELFEDETAEGSA